MLVAPSGFADAAKLPTIHNILPQTKNYLAPNASVPRLRNLGVLDETRGQ